MSEELKAGAELDARLANLLGDDLKVKTHEQIMAALDYLIMPREGREQFWIDLVHEWERLVDRGTTAIGLSEWVWYHRGLDHTLTPQVEAAVAEYRRTPPAYSTDGNAMLALGQLMRERGFDISYSCPSRGCEDTKYNRHWAQFNKESSFDWWGDWGNTEAEARALAAVAALESLPQTTKPPAVS